MDNIQMTYGYGAADCYQDYSEFESAPAEGTEARELAREIEEWVKADRLRPVPSAFQALTPIVARQAAGRWFEPCEALFEFLVEKYPTELVRLIDSNTLDASDLTFAAEALGQHSSSGLVRNVLRPLLSHPQPVVREGAIYGLSRHLDPATSAELRALSELDPSQAVRLAATEALDETIEQACSSD